MKAQNDKVVSITYDLFDKKDNTQLDSNKKDDKPLEFLFGRGSVIHGLEEGLIDMAKGDSKKITVLAQDGYGEYDDSAVGSHSIQEFKNIELKVGMSIFGQSEDGQEIQATLKSYDDKNVTLDYNHPLAGKTLLFNVNIVDIRDATPKELNDGMVNAPESSGCCGDKKNCCNSQDNKA
jgi:FKBP-type peptidyl-prolyl cis-trans isomerase SlyD